MYNESRSVAYVEHSEVPAASVPASNTRKSATVFVTNDGHRGKSDQDRRTADFDDYIRRRSTDHRDDYRNERRTTNRAIYEERRHSDASSNDSNVRTYHVGSIAVPADTRIDDAYRRRGDAPSSRAEESRRPRRPHSANEYGERSERYDDRYVYEDRHRERSREGSDEHRGRGAEIRGRSGYKREIPIYTQPVKAPTIYISRENDYPESNKAAGVASVQGKARYKNLSETYDPTVWTRCGCCLCNLGDQPYY